MLRGQWPWVWCSFRSASKQWYRLSTQSMIELEWKKSRLSKNILLSDISLLLHESSLTFYRLRQSKLLNCRNRANSTLVLGLESDSKSREKILNVLAQFCTNTFLLSYFTTFISTKKKYFREFNKNDTVISAHRYNFKFQNSVFLNILQQYPNT